MNNYLTSILLLVLIFSFDNATANQPAIFVSNIEDAIVLQQNTDIDLILIFTADWCRFCDKLKNDIVSDELMLSDKIVCYIDIDKSRKIAKQYGVKTIPDSRLIKNQKEIKKVIGYNNKTQYIKDLTK